MKIPITAGGAKIIQGPNLGRGYCKIARERMKLKEHCRTWSKVGFIYAVNRKTVMQSIEVMLS